MNQQAARRQNNARYDDTAILPWHKLSPAERFVWLCIVLIPLWWLWGWSYLTVVWAVGILAYQYLHHGNFGLRRPSLVVMAGFATGCYELLATVFWALSQEQSTNFRAFANVILVWVAPMTILWYIQSNNIRVRPRVVIGAFSIVILQIFLLWVFIYFGQGEASFLPPRSVFGLLTGKSPTYIAGAGNSNYLIPYRPEDSSLFGFARYFFFFHGPESLALVLGCICILSLEAKNFLWSTVLFSCSYFFLLLSGTRSVWIALPAIMVIRWLLTTGRAAGLWFVLALIALVSFVGLSVPPVTQSIFQTTTNTAASASEFRADSTEVRAEIYQRTWKEFMNGSDQQFFLGHVEAGESVLPGYEPAKVGTHSFWLSTLLYRAGILGSLMFLTYWLLFIAWLYESRHERPIACFLIFLLFSLAFCVMEFESVVMPLTLVFVTLHEPKVSASDHEF